MLKLKKVSISCALAAGLAAGGAQAAQECGDVSITEMDWGSAIIVTQVATFLLEQGYGCSVTIIPSASTPALVSVTETGKPDILTEIWTNSAPAYVPLLEAGKIKELTQVLSDGGVEGLFIPDYLAEAHPELLTIEGLLANPDLVGGRMHNCPVGWTCQVVASQMAKAGGFAAAGIEDFVHGSGETLSASIGSAYTSQEPWFGYYWSPSTVLGKYPMVQVDLGPHDPDALACNSDLECDTPKLGSWPSSVVTTVVTGTFEVSHPAETDLMRNLSFTNNMMNGLLGWQDANNATGEEAAAYFLSTQQDIWSTWVNDAARGKLSALLQ
ncbi:MAG: glycine betaine/proline transport system substrate-binding protein [Oceanospirillaceae bacterium]|jgi:glycine betaine/proline transport system substrate-binding protein